MKLNLFALALCFMCGGILRIVYIRSYVVFRITRFMNLSARAASRLCTEHDASKTIRMWQSKW